jgi:RNA polymerase sigma-70 factor (ECF subfamily)
MMSNSFSLTPSKVIFEMADLAPSENLPAEALNSLPVPDQQLDIKAITAGIREANEAHFQTFYNEYSPRLFRLLLVITRGDEQMTTDLHQEVMIRAARKMKVFESDYTLWRWLCQVARNAWFDQLRRLKVRKPLETLSGDDFEGSGAVENELCEYVEQDLARLPIEERTLVEAFYYRDQSQKAIAKETGRTVKAIECELARVRQKLKKFILRRLNEKR